MSAALKLEDETPCLSEVDPLRAALDEAGAMVAIARSDAEAAEAALVVALRRARVARQRLEMACGLVEQVAKELGRR